MRVEEEKKKESWMDKLIELLNEWQEKELWKAWAKYLMFDWINKVFRLNNGCSLCQELVLSHRFCFVKWLVDNDKIDFSNLLIAEQTCWTDLFYAFSKYEVLLMILSIQDNPIEWLCEILK